VSAWENACIDRDKLIYYAIIIAYKVKFI